MADAAKGLMGLVKGFLLNHNLTYRGSALL